MMKLTDYKVKEIRCSSGIYKLGQPMEIFDEGSFYRIDSTHIIDKFRIVITKLNGNQLTIHMNNEDTILIVEKK